jgi:hypothetical protein
MLKDGIHWSGSRSRRLGIRMAEDAPGGLFKRIPPRARRWDAERIATALVSKRDRLVEQLPRELAAARGLTRDQCELVIDEAIDYMVTEYAKPIADEEVLARAFWATAAFRVKRMHEGRGATVRAGWRRVDVDDVEIAADHGDPAAQVVRSVELATLLEFAATLTQTERLVLACKFRDGAREQGRVVVARRLGMPVPEVRRAERAIAKKLERFVAIVSAGSLCAHRSGAIEALATGTVGEDQERLARLHLQHCSACRAVYAGHVRALRTGELQRRIAQLLPLPATPAARQGRSFWDWLTDWLSRPFGSDAAQAGLQLAAGTRGIGTIVAAKLAMLCIGGATVLGGVTYCVTTVLQPEPPNTRPRHATVAPNPASSATREPQLPSAGPTLAAVRASHDSTRRHSSTQSQSARTSKGKATTRHEREAAVSPPVRIAGQSSTAEFEPGPASGATTAPAAAPASGGSEFP